MIDPRSALLRSALLRSALFRSALLGSALALSACASGPSNTAVWRFPAGDGDTPLASLPAAAGRVVAVRRVPYANGFAQEIVLDGPRAMSGENRITVEALTTARTGLPGQGAAELKLGPPTDTELAAEMDRALPGVAMRLAAVPERAEGGAVGYATGSAGRLSCVYAWQYLAPARPLSLFEGATGAGELPVSVRVRLCREQPVAALVEALRGLRASRPDGASASAAPRPPFGGDALSEAVGSLPPAASRNAEVVEPVAVPSEAVRPQRRRRHRLAAAPRRPAPHVVSHLVAGIARSARRQSIRRAPTDEVEAARVPRIPLPGEISAPAPAAAHAAAMETGGMPMPR